MESIESQPEVFIEALEAEEKQTIVHCRIQTPGDDAVVRIWPNTFLKEHGSSSVRNLISTFNVSMHPNWTPIPNRQYNFTLIFEGLSKGCTSFDLIEKIPESGGFYVPGISRNTTDVYRVDV